MNNSAISRSNSLKNNSKNYQPQVQQTIRSIDSINSFNKMSESIKEESNIKQNLFTPFKVQPMKNLQKQYSIKQSFRRIDNFQTQKSTPLFFDNRNQEQLMNPQYEGKCKTPEWYSNDDKIEKNLANTKYTLKQSLDNSLNDQLRYQFEMKKQQKNRFGREKKEDSFFRKKQIDNDIMFGEGIEEIQGRQQKTKSNQNSNLQVKQRISSQSIHDTQKIQSSTLTPAYKKNARQKQNQTRQSDAEYKSTTRSFFKRPLSSSNSQEYLKSKFQNKQSILNGKTSRSSSKPKQHRVSVFAKTQPITRENRDSYISYRNKYLPMFYDIHQNQVIKGENNYLSFANNLNKLVFKYNGGHVVTLHNYRLKIKNESQTNLGIKIKCTSPINYKISPCPEKTLQPSQIMCISIEMKLYPHDLNPTTMRHDLSRYKHDKFLIVYWTNENYNDFDFYEGERVLPVVIEQTEEEKLRNQGYAKNINDQKMKQATEQKQIQVYKNLIDDKTQKMNEIDNKVKKIDLIEYKHKYFTVPLFIVFALLGFLFGFWLG